MENKVFPQMNTLVKVRENSLLTKQQKNEMIHSEDEMAAFRILNGTAFFSEAHPSGLEELSLLLQSEKQTLLNWAKTIAPEIPLSKLFDISNLIHNLRVFCKEQVSHKDLSNYYLEGYNKAFFMKISEDDPTTLSHEEADLKDIILRALESYRINESFISIDLLCTFWGHSELLKLSMKCDEARIVDFMKAYIDLELLSIVFQIRESGFALSKPLLSKMRKGFLQFDPAWLLAATETEVNAFFHASPYAEAWNLLASQNEAGLFEVYTDHYLLNMCKKAKLEAFGVFPLFAFIYAKLLDIKTVRTIFNLKRAKVENSEIEERLRGEYGL